MNTKETHRQRLQRLHDAQIAARDPGDSQIRGYDWAKHAAKPIPKQKPLLMEFYALLPARWKGILFGVIFGGIIGIVLVAALPYELHAMALLPMLICGIVGMVIGAMMQENLQP